MIRILIVDDNAVVRKAVRGLIELEPGIQVVGEAGDGNAGLGLALELRPDIVLADFSMPGPSGVEIAAILSVQLPDTHVLVISAYEDFALIRSALTAGAAAFISKRVLDTRLLPAIRDAVEGQTGVVAVVQH